MRIDVDRDSVENSNFLSLWSHSSIDSQSIVESGRFWSVLAVFEATNLENETDATSEKKICCKYHTKLGACQFSYDLEHAEGFPSR